MRLKETTLRSDELLTADIRDRGDIEVTGSTPYGARIAYLDAGEDRTNYRVSVAHVSPGEEIPNAEDAAYVVLGGPNTAVVLTEVSAS